MRKNKPKTAVANLHIRLLDEEKRAFMKAAKASKFNFTTWVRMWLRKGAGLDR